MGVVFFSLIFLAGCGTLETLVNKDGNATSLGNFISGDKSAALPASSTVSIGGTAGTSSAESKVIALYFADPTGKYLVKEERVLPKTVSLARETVTQWLKGPAAGKGTSLLAPVSTAATLLDIAIKDNVAIVDLSKEFLQPNSKVSPEVALYGLVDTLTQFSSIKQVQIRIEGKALTKYGSIDATKLVNKASLIKDQTMTSPVFPSSGTGSNAKSSSGDSTGSSISGNNSTGNTGSGVGTQGKSTNGAPPDSPSSINLFNYPPSST
jgi:Spore germination protein